MQQVLAPERSPDAQTLELVVARYTENLNWLRKVPSAFRITVYDKGTSQGEPDGSVLPPAPRVPRGAARHGAWATVHPLPNLGREAHTYLHHICSRLGNALDPLAGATVFCQGRPFDHAFDFHASLCQMAAQVAAQVEAGQAPWPELGWRWLGHAIDTDTLDGALFRSWSKNPEGGGLDLPGFERALCGGAGSEEYRFVLGGQFVASRAVLEARGPEFWKRALDLSASWPEAAHCYERMWDRVLGVPGPSDELMSGSCTKYLKPVRSGAGSGADGEGSSS